MPGAHRGVSDRAATLPEPARYAPYLSGKYEVAMGLSPLGTDFGNGARDAHVFQFDKTFSQYRENKRMVREQPSELWYGEHEFTEEVERAVCDFSASRLLHEHPDLFSFENGVLSASLSGESISLDSHSEKYRSRFDAIATQVQEDLAVVTVDDENDWLSALHVCAPSGWAPAEKIGKRFTDVHEPVPDIGPVSRKGGPAMRAMAAKGRHVRFVWGLTTDPSLNHHPALRVEGPSTAPQWRAPRFAWTTRTDRTDQSLFVRVERQTLIGLPDVRSALFSIRPYIYDCRSLPADHCRAIAEAVRGMSPEARRYKGIERDWEPMVEWLIARETPA